MKLEDAIPKLKSIEGIPFDDLIKKIPNLKLDKGKTGKLLETIIGLSASSNIRDFEDGELKTNKANKLGKPLETMFIMQINNEFDNIISGKPFKESRLYEKIKRVVYVPVCKIGAEKDWFFHSHLYWDLEKDIKLYDILNKDYELIVNEIKKNLNKSSKELLHTASGEFIQIRTKDAKTYTPIYSTNYQRYVSNKNFAFYFKKEFMLHLQKISNFKPIF